MAGSESFANRTLWHFISGTGVLRPKELIASELKRNEAKILDGLLFYQKPRCPAGEELKEKTITGNQQDFLQKLSVFLSLGELQCYQLFCSYLLHDYRGSQKNLQQLLSNERHSHTLMLKVRDYYYTERLYILHVLKRILSLWPDPEYLYKEQYAEFVNNLILDDKLIKKIKEQFCTVCEMTLPTWETNGPLMNERQALVWAQQNLKEQCELLQILFVYYKDFETDLNGIIDLIERFKQHGFGRHQKYKHILEESSEKFLRRICYLEVLVLLELLDIENIYHSSKENNLADHIFLKDKTTFQKLDRVMQDLNKEVAYGPLLLSWSVIRQLYLDEDDFVTTRKFGNLALQLNVFEFMSLMLETEPFCGKTTVASFSHYVVYTTLFTTLAVYDENTLGGHRDSEILYEVSAKLLKKEFVATDFWQKGLDEGLGTLFQSAIEWFPLDFSTLLRFSVALATGSKESAKKIMAVWKRLPRYTEYLDRNSSQDLVQTADSALWQLAREKLPYIIGEFRIPTGVYGQIIQTSGQSDSQGSPVIQWEFAFNGWQLLECEVEELLHQISQGSGMVSPVQVARVSAITELVKSLLTSDLEMVDQLTGITSLLYQVIHRFAGQKPPPLDLLATSVECLTCVAKKHPKQVWHNMKQTGLLPYLTENVDNMAEVLSGQGLSAGLFGVLLAGSECTQGRYPLTTAFLDFISCLIKPMFQSGKENDLMACVMFILREVFPAFQKWRYYNTNRREVIGQKCLENFHSILNFMSARNKKVNSKKPQLQEVVVYSLLFSEAGRALLEIIATGVDSVELALSQQGSTFEGSGVEIIQMIQLAFSVLNRLLLMKSPELPISPVENALASQPAGRQHHHVVATISEYICHRHNPRLPTLATLLLKRLALVLPMSILACLGNDAEAIRDMYLTRLQAVTEDLRLKVVVLELLSVCVEAQPGLIEIFLNVQPAESGVGKKDLSLGKTSCLQTVLDLMDYRKQGTYQCPPDLLCACTEFIHALWAGLRETAMSVLRNRRTFWPSICAPLNRELCKLGDDDEKVLSLPYEMKTVAYVLKIMAQEFYSAADLKLNSHIETVFQDTKNQSNRLKYWSRYICDCLKAEGESQELLEENMADNPTLQLLIAWKNFLVTVTALKIEDIKVNPEEKEMILLDLLEGILAQFVGTQTSLTVDIKLASVTSALLFTLVKNWTGQVTSWANILPLMHDAVRQSCGSCETLVPCVQIGLLGSMVTIIQHARKSSTASVAMERVRPIVPTVCSVLLQSTQQLPTPKDLQSNTGTQCQPSTDPSMTDPRLKLQVVTCSLLVELIKFVDSPDIWLAALREHAILQTLLISTEIYLKGRQGLHYLHTLFLLFLTIASSKKGAESLAMSGLTQHTCLPILSLYQISDLLPLASAPVIPPKKVGSGTLLTWHGVFCLCIELYNTVLVTLRYSFLEDMLNFLGSHQDRLLQSLEIARLGLFDIALKEAEQTCTLIERLAHFSREWRMALPDTVNKFLRSMLYMCQTFISLLIRPRYLQLILEHHGGQKRQGKGRDSSSPIPPILQHQTSTEDIEQPTVQLTHIQHSMLRIVCQSFSALKCFTPDLCEILLDQNMDLSEYEPFLAIGFSTPSVDQDFQPTFGTMLSCVNVCIRLLQKMEARVVSPHRSPDTAASQQIPKSLVLYVLETSLYIIMSQAMRYLKEPNLSARDKPLLKRELGAEMIHFCLESIDSSEGCTTSPGGTTLLTSPGGPSPSTSILARSFSQTCFSTNQEQAFFKIVQEFVKQVLR
ncbi:hypothetical protein ScPMuIL_009975 [Solemya velum]